MGWFERVGELMGKLKSGSSEQNIIRNSHKWKIGRMTLRKTLEKLAMWVLSSAGELGCLSVDKLRVQ